MALVKTWAEPYKIKMVEPVFMTTKAQRKKAIEAAGGTSVKL